ncbi:MAG: efflux RND transporter periplasmic adaptor subunit [Bacillota bacterium]
MKRFRAAAFIRTIFIVALLALAAFATAHLVLRWVRPQVMVTHAVEGPVIQAFYATGTLLPEREYPIKSNAPGYLTKVFVDKGDQVKLDQPLAVVLEDGVQNKFEQSKADRDLKAKLADEKTSPMLAELDSRIAGTVELLEIARREQKRLSDAAARNAASQSDLDRALDRTQTLSIQLAGLKAQRDTKKLELQKDLEVAEAALRIAQWNVDRQTIRCPIDNAQVLDRPVTIGTRLAVNDHIMQVADARPENLVMRAAVDEEDKTQVHLNQLVHMTLYAFGDRVFEGRVHRIYPKADPERRTFEIDVEMLEKNPAYAAGMTGELAFIIDRKDIAQVIPSQAVQSNSVYVIRNNQIEQADVHIGLRSVERTEILSGLRPDDLVLLSPIDAMKPGQHVRTDFIDPVTAANLNKPKQQEGSPFRGFH